MSTLSPIRLGYLSLSRLIQIGGILVVILVSAPVLLVYLIGPLLAAGSYGNPDASQWVREVGRLLAHKHPILFYLAAFWFLQSACGRFADGRIFDQKTIRSVAFAGLALVGAFVALIVRPFMWSGRSSNDVDMAPHLAHLRTLYGSQEMQIAALVIGTVGCMLLLLAFVTHRGAAAQAENDQMF